MRFILYFIVFINVSLTLYVFYGLLIIYINKFKRHLKTTWRVKNTRMLNSTASIM